MDAADQERHESEALLHAPLLLVTGASGFVGSFIASTLRGSCRVRTAGRRASGGDSAHHAVGGLGLETDWREALEGAEIVVHAAGPAHAKHSAEALRRAIVEGSAALAEQAARAGVKRFIYISSIRACASHSTGVALSEGAPPHPDDAYGRAKLEAEQAILAETALHPVALRPPLVVGPAAKGNFASFLRLLDTPLPLPLAGMNNKRNVISLASLGAAVRAAIENDEASAAGVFHVADQPAVSTTEMAALVRQGMGRPRRLFEARGIAAISPRPLVQSLEVDDRRFRTGFRYGGQDAREALLACGRAWAAR